MPKLAFKTRSRTLPDSDETVVELHLSGFIDAANYSIFEKSLEDAFALGGRSLLIDFSRVQRSSTQRRAWSTTISDPRLER